MNAGYNLVFKWSQCSCSIFSMPPWVKSCLFKCFNIN